MLQVKAEAGRGEHAQVRRPFRLKQVMETDPHSVAVVFSGPRLGSRGCSCHLFPSDPCRMAMLGQTC